MRLRYLRFSALSPDQMVQARTIYDEAFPAWEREPFAELMAADNDAGRTQIAMIDGGQVVGIAVASRLESVGWSFLEYFAVRKDRRDRGLGSRLWRALVRRLGDRAFPMVLEVERVEDAGDDPDERRRRERRIRFYARRRAGRLAVAPYRVPHLDAPGTSEMTLLAVPRKGEAPPSGDALRDLVSAAYVEGYGLPSEDERRLEALKSVEG